MNNNFSKTEFQTEFQTEISLIEPKPPEDLGSGGSFSIPTISEPLQAIPFVDNSSIIPIENGSIQELIEVSNFSSDSLIGNTSVVNAQAAVNQEEVLTNSVSKVVDSDLLFQNLDSETISNGEGIEAKASELAQNLSAKKLDEAIKQEIELFLDSNEDLKTIAQEIQAFLENDEVDNSDSDLSEDLEDEGSRVKGYDGEDVDDEDFDDNDDNENEDDGEEDDDDDDEEEDDDDDDDDDDDEKREDFFVAITPGDQILINNFLSTAVNIPFTNIYEKIGNFNTALNDLRTYFAQPTGRPIEERVPGRLFIIRLDEGITVVARDFSTDGRPTIEIQDNSSGTSRAIAKVRYELLP